MEAPGKIEDYKMNVHTPEAKSKPVAVPARPLLRIEVKKKPHQPHAVAILSPTLIHRRSLLGLSVAKVQIGRSSNRHRNGTAFPEVCCEK